MLTRLMVTLMTTMMTVTPLMIIVIVIMMMKMMVLVMAIVDVRTLMMVMTRVVVGAPVGSMTAIATNRSLMTMCWDVLGIAVAPSSGCRCSIPAVVLIIICGAGFRV